ncbi:MAG: hypothetical protein CMQ40_01410 [Gammaproteobacteria bacterium]|nr:hypothetical protein [Gammaproteobacteria bacterium]
MGKHEIYIDMDGVCVDFIRDALLVQGYDPEETLIRWKAEQPGQLFPTEVIPKDPENFFTFEALDNKEFWMNLKPYDWFEELYSELTKLGSVLFLSAPTGSPACMSGKHQWLINRFGPDFSNFIFTRHKDRLAHSRAILIDDMPFNVSSFQDRGGNAILFPRIWNKLHMIEDPKNYILSAVKNLMSS